MRKRIDKAEWEKLAEPLRALYVDSGDGTYVLELEDDDDLTGLKKNQERLLAEKKKLAEERRKLEARLAEIEAKAKEEELKALEAEGKVEEIKKRIESEYQAQLEAERAAKEQILEAHKNSMLQSAITKAAVELSGERAALIEPHLRNRFQVIEEDGQFKVVITDPEGVPNPARTVEKLIEEFRSNDLYAPLIKGRNSTGGGATGGGTGGGGTSEWERYFDPSNPDYSLTKQTELEGENPDLYKQLRAKFNLDDPMAAAARQRPAMRPR